MPPAVSLFAVIRRLLFLRFLLLFQLHHLFVGQFEGADIELILPAEVVDATHQVVQVAGLFYRFTGGPVECEGVAASTQIGEGDGFVDVVGDERGNSRTLSILIGDDFGMFAVVGKPVVVGPVVSDSQGFGLALVGGVTRIELCFSGVLP